MNKEKYIGESMMTKKPEKKLGFILSGRANQRITEEVLRELEDVFDMYEKKYKQDFNELRQLILSVSGNKLALSDKLGSNTDIGITQKTITNAINQIWQKLAEITGEISQGIHVTVTPEYFISEDGAEVKIAASAGDGIFEELRIYINDDLAVEKENVQRLNHTALMTETSTIHTVAKILGMEYEDTKIVTKYFPFFIGCGAVWQDILTDSNARQYNGSLRGSYDIKVENDGDRVFIVIPSSMRDQITRIDMNSFEVPVEVENVDIYTVYSSKNAYRKGIYNIDIN